MPPVNVRKVYNCAHEQFVLTKYTSIWKYEFIPNERTFAFRLSIYMCVCVHCMANLAVSGQCKLWLWLYSRSLLNIFIYFLCWRLIFMYFIENNNNNKCSMHSGDHTVRMTHTRNEAHSHSCTSTTRWMARDYSAIMLIDSHLIFILIENKMYKIHIPLTVPAQSARTYSGWQR